MASIIEGYNYDVFISYRQKDNKHDGWVTEFVNNLKGELESTFKEDISVYFDINPHDGLLETYDVDESLKEKLKCLIFIPIISRTYCDPKSFAWEHEFKAFVEMASKDQFGLKVKLPNGNVTGRVLPVQIHDLYSEDKATIEKELGGVLRAIEFIYKEPGVNKPLTEKDNEDKNTSKTNYRIQINKVANAIDEIIHGLRTIHIASAGKNVQLEQKVTITKKGSEIEIQKGETVSKKNFKRLLVFGLLVILCIACVFGILKVIEKSKQAVDIAKLEKSIAVLPFVNDSPDQENSYFINGIMDEILNNLQKIKDFRVLSRTSTEQYRDSNRPTIPEIAKKLDVNYIVEGSGQKYGNTFRLRVQLIAAKNEKHLWGESYEREIIDTKDIFRIQSEVAKAIASELKAIVTPEEKNMIERKVNTNLTAYDFYLRGEEEIYSYGLGGLNRESIEKAKGLFKKALEHDSTFAGGYTGLGKYYWKKYAMDNLDIYADSMLILANTALIYDKQSTEAHLIRGKYYAINGNFSKAIEEYDIAIMINPNYWQAFFEKGALPCDSKNRIENLLKAITLNHGTELTSLLHHASWQFYNLGFPEKGDHYCEQALTLNGDSVENLACFSHREFVQGNYRKALEFIEEINAINPVYIDSDRFAALLLYRGLALNYLYTGQFEKSLKYANKWVEILKASGETNQIFQNEWYQIGYIYWINGYKNEAGFYFDKQFKNSLEIIKKTSDYKKSDINEYFNGQAHYCIACIYAVRGDKEKVFENLKRFNQRQRFDLSEVTLIKNNPIFNSFRDEPEYRKIIKDMEAKYQAEHERVRKWLEEQGQL